MAVLGGVLCFSSSSTLVKWSETNGGAITFWRLLISALLWWVILGVRYQRTGRRVPGPTTWRMMFPVALCFGLNLTVFFTAIQKTSIAHAEFITALGPLLLVPAGALLFGDRPDNRALRWGLVTVAGLAIVLFSGGDAGGATVGGDLMVGVVVMLWAGYLLTSRRARASVGLVDFMATLMNLAFLITIPATVALAGDRLWSMP
ncbi:MAG: DMT family transporter, partial [Desertimonas sp.]